MKRLLAFLLLLLVCDFLQTDFPSCAIPDYSSQWRIAAGGAYPTRKQHASDRPALAGMAVVDAWHFRPTMHQFSAPTSQSCCGERLPQAQPHGGWPEGKGLHGKLYRKLNNFKEFIEKSYKLFRIIEFPIEFPAWPLAASKVVAAAENKATPPAADRPSARAEI